MISTKEATKESTQDNHGHSHEVPHVHGPNCNHHHHHEALKPITREAPKVGRNDPCPCGSGQKFKKCHGK